MIQLQNQSLTCDLCPGALMFAHGVCCGQTVFAHNSNNGTSLGFRSGFLLITPPQVTLPLWPLPIMAVFHAHVSTEVSQEDIRVASWITTEHPTKAGYSELLQSGSILWSKGTGKQSSLPLADKSKIQTANRGHTWIPTPACCQGQLQTRTQSNPSPGGRFQRPSSALRWVWLYLVRIKVRLYVPVVSPNSRGSVCQGPHPWPPYRGKIVNEHLVVGSLLSFPTVANVSIMTEPWLLTENDLIERHVYERELEAICCF